MKIKQISYQKETANSENQQNPIPIPITELANNGFLGQMQGLIQDYQFWYQTLKDR